MNVIIAGNLTFPFGSAAGARVRNLSLGLKECGANVHVMAMAPSGEEAVPYLEQKIHWHEGVSYELMAQEVKPLLFKRFKKKSLSRLPRKPLRVSQKFQWLLRLYGTILPTRHRLEKAIKANRCELFIGYGRNFSLLFPLAKTCRRMGVSCILDVVEIMDQFKGFGDWISPLWWDCRLGTSWLPRYFDGFTTITTRLEQFYRGRGCRRILIVPAIEGWENLVDSLPKISGKPFRLLYIGSLVERDSPEILFEAIRILARKKFPLFLEVLGRYESHKKGKRLQEACQKDPFLQGVVTFSGEMSDGEIQQRMRNADGLILTRRNSVAEVCSFPTRLAEYLKFGIPVLVSNVGDIPLYLRHMQDAVLLSPDDPESIATSIERIANSPDRGEAIGVQGRLRGQECFDRKNHARRILEFVEEIREKRTN